MICEICGSQSIKKENGVFVCQECGTEYSLEEAKKLLTEIGEGQNESQSGLTMSSSPDVNKEPSGEELLQKLYVWAAYLEAIKPWMYYVDDSKKNFDEVTDSDFLDECLKISPNVEGWMFDPTHYGLYGVQDQPKQCVPGLLPYVFWYNVMVHNDELGFNRVYRLNDEHVGRDGIKRHYIKASNGAELSIETQTHMLCISDEPLRTFFISQPKGTTFKFWNVKQFMQQGFFKYTVTTKEVPWQNSSQLEEKFNLAKKYLDEYADMYSDAYKKFSEDYEKNLNNIKKLRSELPNMIKLFDLPKKYWNTRDIYELIDILVDRRADNWKEAINQYKTDTYRSSVVYSLRDLTLRLGDLSLCIQRGFNAINMKMDSMNALISESIEIQRSSNEYLKNIAHDTRYSLICQLID